MERKAFLATSPQTHYTACGLSGLHGLIHFSEKQSSKAQQYPVKAQVAVRDIGSGNLSRSGILDGNYHQYWWQEELLSGTWRSCVMEPEK